MSSLPPVRAEHFYRVEGSTFISTARRFCLSATPPPRALLASLPSLRIPLVWCLLAFLPSLRIPLSLCVMSFFLRSCKVCVFPFLCVMSSSLRSSFLFILVVLLFPSLFSISTGRRLFHPVFFLWVLFRLLGFGFCRDSFSDIYIYIIYIL